jgi:hypothetical protein
MLVLKRATFISFALLTLVIFAAQSASAQLRLPRPSPKASVMQTIGVTDLTITYSRPGVKGRTIWGDWPAEVKGEGTLDNQNARPAGAPIVPYGHLWRTGANDATQFVVTDDVLVNGSPLPAGTYSLHTIPGKDEWTVVFNGTANQWGSFNYDPAKDTLRIKAKPQTVTDSQEWMAFTVDPAADNSAVVNIRWEKVRVPFTVEVKDVAALALTKARAAVAAAKPDDWQTPFSAANYAKQNKAMDDATKWYDQTLKIVDEQVKAKPTFQLLSRRATVLAQAGRTPEAIAAAEKAIEQGKIEKADTAPLEKRLADMKAGKQ